MNRSKRFFPYRNMENRLTDCLLWQRLCQWNVWRILFLFIFILLSGCASSGAITAKDQAAIASGEKALIVLRIKCTVDNQPYEPFIKPSFTGAGPIFSFGMGTFETVGEPRYAAHGFLSEESRQAGWTYFVLPPGVYYFAVLGPDSSSAFYLEKAPRWRLDVPENTKLIYVGTLHFTGKMEGKLLFGEKIIRPAVGDEISLKDEHEVASHLLAEHLPAAGEVKTTLLQRWHPGDSIIIRTPKRSKNE